MADGTISSIDEATGVLTIEAEDIITNGYVVADHGSASGGSYASLFNGSVDGSPTSGTLTYTFEGGDGAYDLELFVYDENDGASPLEVRINGTLIDTVVMNTNTGDGGVSATSLISYTLNDLDLEFGDVITITGSRDLAEWARVDKLTFSPLGEVTPTPAPTPTPTPSAEPLVIEAESIIANGFVVEATGLASGGEVASLLNSGGTSGTLNYTFGGGTGDYTLTIAAFDENDGASTLNVLVNGTLVQTLTMDNATGSGALKASNLLDFTVTGLSLEAGDLVQIMATQNANEWVRIDTLTFTPEGDTTPAPTPTNTAPEGDIADVNAVVGTPVTLDLSTLFTDADDDALTFSISGPGASIASLDGSTLTLDASAAGSFDITVTANDGTVDSAPVTFTVSATAPTPTGESIVVEAEDLVLNGYVVETSGAASGGEYAGLFTGTVEGSPTTGTMTYTFTGGAGDYTLYLDVFDESDGNSTLEVRVNGVLIETVSMNTDTGSGVANAASLITYSVAGLSLESGDIVEITGNRDNAEWARVDKLTFTPEGDTTPAPTPTNTAPEGDIADVNAVVGTPVTLDLSTLFTDADDDALTFSISGPGASIASLDGSTLTVDAFAAGSYDITVTANDGTVDSAPVTFTVSATAPVAGGSTIVVEAEDIIANGFIVENSSPASDGQVASLLNSGNTSGTLAYTFAGGEGTYDLTIAAFDENDGASSFDVLVNGSLVQTITMNNSTNSGGMKASNLLDFTIAGLSLEAGDTIQIAATQNADEWVRIDTLTFTPIDGTPGPTNTAPTGDIADVDAVVGTPITIDLDAAFSDIDGDALTYTLSGAGAAAGSIDGSTLTIDPAAAGDFALTVTANDGTVDSAPVTFTVSATLPTPVGETFEVEAESIIAEGFIVENTGLASEGAVASLFNSGATEGTLAYTFAGGDAVYTLTLSAFDENDGAASIDIFVNDELVATIDMDGATSAGYMTSGTLKEFPIPGLELRTGDVIELVGTKNNNEEVRIDKLAFAQTGELTTPTPTPTGEPVVIEAEDLVLDGYVVETSAAASGGEYAGLFTGTVEGSPTTGTMMYTWAGDNGTFDLDLAVFDEADGQSPLEIRVDGVLVATIVMNTDTGSNAANAGSLMTYTVEGLEIENGDVIEITGARDNAEWARVDKLTFTPVGETTPPNTAPTGSIDDVTAELGTPVIIDLTTVFTDVDGDALTFSLSGAGAAIASIDGSTLTIDPFVEGNFELIVTANDGTADSAPVSFTVTAEEANIAPTGDIDDVNATIGTPVVLDLSTLFTDANGDALTFSVSGAGAAIASLDGSTLTLDPQTAGDFELTVTANDGEDDSDPVSFTVTAAPDNSAPTGDIDDVNATIGTPVVLDLLTLFTDADGDEMTFSLSGGGAAIASLDGSTLTIDPQAVGTYGLSVTANDGAVDSEPVIFNVTANFPNNAPETTLGDLTMDLGEPLVIDLNNFFSDADSDALTFSLGGADAAVATLDGATLTIDPANAGDFELTITATDGEDSVDADITVTTLPPNSAPQGYLFDFALDLNSEIAINLDSAFFDIDGDDLSFTLTAGQAALFTTLDGSTLTINPTDPDLWGEFDITITANDGEVDSTPVTFTLSIPDTNQGPTGTPTAVLTNGIEDTPTVVSEAQLLEGLTDPEGDAMQITSISSSNGGVVDNRNGSYTVVTTQNFTGALTLTYTVSDGKSGLLENVTQTLNITNVNDAPVIADLSGLDLTLDEDETVEATPAEIQAYLGALVADVDGDVVTVSLTFTYPVESGLAEEVIVVNPAEDFSWTPPQDYNGDITLTVLADDGELSTTKQATLTVLPVNDAPVVADLTGLILPTEEDTPVDATVAEINAYLDAYTSDVDGDEVNLTITLTYPEISGIADETIVVDRGQPLSWTPPADFTGPVAATLVFDDGAGEANSQVTQVVTIAVTPVNDAPTAVDDAFTVPGDGTTNAFNVLADNGNGVDFDIDGDAISVVAASGTTANGGSVTIDETGAISYTSAVGYYGEDTFTYTLTDGAETSTAVATFTVEPVDVLPIAVDDEFYLSAGGSVSGNVLADNGNGADFDPDGGTVTFLYPSQWVSEGTLTLSSNGDFTFTAPNYDFSANPITFQYVIQDDEGDTAEGTAVFFYEAPSSPASSAMSSIGPMARSSSADSSSSSDAGQQTGGPSDFLLDAAFGQRADVSSVQMITDLGQSFATGTVMPVFESDLQVLDALYGGDAGGMFAHTDDYFLTS
ncbi:MAG: hypothetical protein CME88_02495 [Hirschia sp.]|nr:hypothetical protein [Hirschia sp.]MBF17232.1 hypothetical protein [Hirschia sp.]